MMENIEDVAEGVGWYRFGYRWPRHRRTWRWTGNTFRLLCGYRGNLVLGSQSPLARGSSDLLSPLSSWRDIEL